jgi:hypothetical protein
MRLDRSLQHVEFDCNGDDSAASVYIPAVRLLAVDDQEIEVDVLKRGSGQMEFGQQNYLLSTG